MNRLMKKIKHQCCNDDVECEKIIKEEFREVDVVVGRSHHMDSFDDIYYYDTFKGEKRQSNYHHAEINDIVFRYKDVYTSFNSKVLYDKYHHELGNTFRGILGVRTYDNGRIEKYIKSVEGIEDEEKNNAEICLDIVINGGIKNE